MVPPLTRLCARRTGSWRPQRFFWDYIIAKTGESLRNLGTDTIDVQQLHRWADHWLDQGDWL